MTELNPEEAAWIEYRDELLETAREHALAERAERAASEDAIRQLLALGVLARAISKGIGSTDDAFQEAIDDGLSEQYAKVAAKAAARRRRRA